MYIHIYNSKELNVTQTSLVFPNDTKQSLGALSVI
jgi:hypothetical protein